MGHRPAGLSESSERWDLCVPCAGATRRNHQLRRRKVPSLARALAVTLRLVRVHLAHLFQQVPRIRPRNVGRPGTIAIALLRPAGHGRLLHALRHAKKVRDNSLKGKLTGRRHACLTLAQVPKCQLMSRLAVALLTLLSALMLGLNACAQSFAGNDKTEKMLEALSKKIDEQNAKIDPLSQQILKLEQQVSKFRPGIMIGETPSPSPSSNATAEAPKPTQQSGNSHVVAKGETLTSIAKMHKVTVEQLQKFNHIENDRKLQIGQTIMIPPSASSPGASTTPNG